MRPRIAQVTGSREVRSCRGQKVQTAGLDPLPFRCDGRPQIPRRLRHVRLGKGGATLASVLGARWHDGCTPGPRARISSREQRPLTDSHGYDRSSVRPRDVQGSRCSDCGVPDVAGLRLLQADRDGGSWRGPVLRAFPDPRMRSGAGGPGLCDRQGQQHTRLGARQEFHGLLLAHYAVRKLMHEAALKADEDPEPLSFVQAVRVIRRKLPVFAATPSGNSTPA